MTHHCFFEMVTSLPNRHFHQALYKPLLLTAHTMWSITTKMIDKRELLLPFLWRNLRCSPGLLTTWKVCGCALWWQSEVRVGVFMSQCMVGICSLFDGCSHFPCAGGRKKKDGCLFSDVGFQAKEFHEHCSLQATRRALQSASLYSHIQSCFSRRTWEWGCVDCLFMMGSTLSGDRDLSY